MPTIRFLLVFLAFAGILSVGSVSGQSRVEDSLSARMGLYRLKQPSGLLFVHFDKNVYTEGETVWFTAYLLGGDRGGMRHTLSVSMIGNPGRTVVLTRQSVMGNGIARGDFQIPPNTVPGGYSFVSHTNVLLDGKPADTFIQPITIMAVASPPFSASLKLLDPVVEGGPYRVLLEGSTQEKFNLAGAALRYAIGALGDSLGRVAETDARGQYVFTVPQTDSATALRVMVRHGKASRELSISVPARLTKATVRFYPEGGHLVHDLQGYVGWEARTVSGQPFRASGVLYRNGVPVDTVETNDLGIGKFILTPGKDAVYAFRLRNTGLVPASYPLPVVLPEGYALTLRKAATGDSAKVYIRGSRPGTVTLLIHNYRGLYASVTIRMASATHPVTVPLKGVPRGIMAMTLADSLGRPLAERLFFAHYLSGPLFALETDKASYGVREKVTLRLRLKDAEGKPAQGLVSVACVQDNRLLAGNATDMESYAYLERELGALPLSPSGGYYRDRSYVEDLLMVRGWRRYTWQELGSLSPADTVHDWGSLTYAGSVLRYGKPLKKPEAVRVSHGLLGSVIMTDSTGHFALPHGLLVSKADQKTAIDAGGEKEGYTIELKDPYARLAPLLAAGLASPPPGSVFPSTGVQVLGGQERAIVMNEVVLRGVRDNSVFGAGYGNANACGDYVCLSEVLNCPAHRGDSRNRRPVVGQQYWCRIFNTEVGNFAIMEQKPPFSAIVRYLGCGIDDKDKRRLLVDGIYKNKEFYGLDYSIENLPGPEYHATLYWHHGLPLDAEGRGEVSFYTSDITGKFKIIVQGVSNAEALYGEGGFTVTKK